MCNSNNPYWGECHCGEIMNRADFEASNGLCSECQPVASLIELCEDFEASGLPQDVIADQWDKELPEGWTQERVDALIKWLSQIG